MRLSRESVKAMMPDDTSIETHDLGLASYLLTRGVPVASKKNGISPRTGAARCTWRFQHPTLKLFVHEFFEPIYICPASLFQNRDHLKSGMFLPAA